MHASRSVTVTTRRSAPSERRRRCTRRPTVDSVAAAKNAQLSRERVVTVGFDSLAAGHPEWLSDGTHLTLDGLGQYLNLITLMVTAAQNNLC